MFGIETFHGFTGNKSNSIIGMVRPEWLSQIMKTSITIHSMFTRNPFITYHCAALYITSFNSVIIAMGGMEWVTVTDYENLNNPS